MSDGGVGIEEVLGCKGYFGFGGGYLTLIRDRQAVYCNTCPLAGECWTTHRARVQGMFPEMTQGYEEVLKIFGGDASKAEQFWVEHEGMPTPYITVMLGNMEDGRAVAATGKPLERGEATLPYPFKR